MTGFHGVMGGGGVLAVLLLLVAGCTTSSKIHMDTLAGIRRGMSADEVAGRTAGEPLATLRIAEDPDVRVDVYDMVTATEMVHGTAYVGGFDGSSGYTVPTMTAVDVTEPYFLFYRHDALEFWGFLDEFNRAEDDAVRDLAAGVGAAYRDEMERRERQRSVRF